MFGTYFGDYLLKNGLISEADMDTIVLRPHSETMQKLVERNCFTPDEAEKTAAAYRKESGLSDEELDALKSGDLERIIPVFIYFDASGEMEKNWESYRLDNGLSGSDIERIMESGNEELILPEYVRSDPKLYNRYVELTLQYLLNHVSNRIFVKKAYEVREYEFECLAYQQLKGAHHMFLGFSAKGGNLLTLANVFAKREFLKMDKGAYDSVCELINCLNGLYASELSNEDIYLEIALPGFGSDRKLVSNGAIYCLPLVVDGAEIDMLVSMNTDIQIV